MASLRGVFSVRCSVLCCERLNACAEDHLRRMNYQMTQDTADDTCEGPLGDVFARRMWGQLSLHVIKPPQYHTLSLGRYIGGVLHMKMTVK